MYKTTHNTFGIAMHFGDDDTCDASKGKLNTLWQSIAMPFDDHENCDQENVDKNKKSDPKR